MKARSVGEQGRNPGKDDSFQAIITKKVVILVEIRSFEYLVFGCSSLRMSLLK